MEFLSDYDFQLPPELIASQPKPIRSQARLLVCKRDQESCSHDHFYHIGHYLRPGDALVLNNTKVIPARLFAHKETGGKVELLLCRKVSPGQWLCLINGRGRIRLGTKLTPEHPWNTADQQEPHILVQQKSAEERGSFEVSANFDLTEYAKSHGQVPLPHYVHRPTEETDHERYQTIYARPEKEGAVAAPTAGLHFDQYILDQLRHMGVSIVEVTLQVGPGTFLPIRTDKLDAHVMHGEVYEMDSQAAEQLNRVRAQGGRIVAVGTTSLRVLEQVKANAKAQGVDAFRAESGITNLFIRPGFRFLAADSLVTNFHLPKSTLFVLIAAILGKEKAQQVYQEAIEQKYRFYSYGDSCFFDIRTSPLASE